MDFAPARPETKPTDCHPSNVLSAAFQRSAPPGRYADGNGLYLFVQPSGTRSWIQRLVVRGRALEILEAARTLGEGAGPLVFTRGQGKPLNDKELRWLVREQGIAAVPHGFRSSFRDWAAEETDHPREVIEAALAHVVRNRVEAAYARSDLFERRRVLMDDWARYLA